MAWTPPTAEQRRQLAALQQLHYAWSGQQVADGVDGPVPSGRPAKSDYNQHVPDLDAPAAAQDAFHTKARTLMGLPQMAGA